MTNAALLSTLSIASLVACTASPTMPTRTLTPQPSAPIVHAEAAVQPAALDAPPAVAQGAHTYAWTPSQYEARVTITNTTSRPETFVLAVYVSYERSISFASQELHSFVDIVVPAGEGRMLDGLVPEACSTYFQADVYAGITAEQVERGLDIHPLAVPKIYEATHKYGKSRTTCARPAPPVIVVPPVVAPPVVTPRTTPCVFVPGTNCGPDGTRYPKGSIS